MTPAGTTRNSRWLEHKMSPRTRKQRVLTSWYSPRCAPVDSQWMLTILRSRQLADRLVRYQPSQRIIDSGSSPDFPLAGMDRIAIRPWRSDLMDRSSLPTTNKDFSGMLVSQECTPQ